MKAVNIKWDLTGEELTDKEKEDILAELPTEVEIPENIDEKEIDDWLSDKYEWCCCYDLEDDTTEFMEDANTKWYDDDIASALEYWSIPATKENIEKVATPEFVNSFRQTIIQFGNDLLIDRVLSVFPMETM